MICLEYRIDNNKIILRLEPGEEVIDSLRELRDKLDIENGFFFGIGAVDKLKLGNYDVEDKNYREKEFTGSYEVSNFKGNMGPDKIHAHITVGDENFDTLAGHCSEARVSGTFEIILRRSDEFKLTHKFDTETGLDVWDL